MSASTSKSSYGTMVGWGEGGGGALREDTAIIVAPSLVAEMWLITHRPLTTEML